MEEKKTHVCYPVIVQKNVFDQLKENIKREHAELINFKNRMQNEQRESMQYANQSLLYELTAIADHFEKAFDALPDDKKKESWVIGIGYIKDQLMKFLSDQGCTEIEVKVKDIFNPEFHESIETKDEKGFKENEIISIVQRGYRLNGRVLRPVRVIVAKE